MTWALELGLGSQTLAAQSDTQGAGESYTYYIHSKREQVSGDDYNTTKLNCQSTVVWGKIQIAPSHPYSPFTPA